MSRYIGTKVEVEFGIQINNDNTFTLSLTEPQVDGLSLNYDRWVYKVTITNGTTTLEIQNGQILIQ